MTHERILIIKLGSLGDVVQAEGVYRDIRSYHPDATIIAMTSPPYRPFFERCPWVDEVFIDPRRPRWNAAQMIKLRNRLKKLKITMVYDLQQVKRTRFYYRWFMAEVPWMGKAPGCKYFFQHIPGTCALEQFSAQLEHLDIPNDHVFKPDLHWMAEDMEKAKAAAGLAPPYVVLVPGASAGHARKCWPYYNQLAGWLKTRGITPVIVPGPAEAGARRTYPDAVVLSDGNRYYNYFELAGILDGAEFAVGNDTGPMHIAAHLGLPGLALFSDHTTPRQTGLHYSRFRFLEAADLQTLSVSRVQEEIEKFLFPGGKLQGPNEQTRAVS